MEFIYGIPYNIPYTQFYIGTLADIQEKETHLFSHHNMPHHDFCHLSMLTETKKFQKEDGNAQNRIHDKRLADAWI
jgi:hypothetical protein